MVRYIAASVVLALALAACGGDDAGMPASDTVERVSASADVDGAILSGKQPLLNGELQDLAEYRGDVVLVVNTASECGFTPQFGGLERLYDERRSEGLVVLGFPADDVANQEPREDAEIAEFCEENFGVSFPMFAKSNLVSDPVNPLFERLAAAAGAPTWNFNKYLLDRTGDVVERFDAGDSPEDLRAPIDELLEGSRH